MKKLEKFLSIANMVLTILAKIWLIVILCIAMYLLWEGLLLASTDGTVAVRIVGFRELFN